MEEKGEISPFRKGVQGLVRDGAEGRARAAVTSADADMLLFHLLRGHTFEV